MYLTKLIVPLNGRKAFSMLYDCQQLHRYLCGCFGQDRKAQNLLYRTNVLGSRLHIYLYSHERPENIPADAMVAGQRDMGDWLNTLKEDDVLGFDLVACPTRKVYQAERNKNSRRRILRDPEERRAWLQQKGQQNGFDIVDAAEVEQSHIYGRHGETKGGKMHLDAYHYQGVLRITDAQAFRQAMAQGIGPGKAYGLGMLMVKRL